MSDKKKGKENKSEKEKERKAERSTVKMYYWNVALSEHCQDVPLECGSVHWNTEEVCEVAPFMETWRIFGAIYMASQRPWPVKASQSAIRSRPGKARGEEHEDKQRISLAVLWSLVSEFHGFMLQCCTAWLKVERMM